MEAFERWWASEVVTHEDGLIHIPSHKEAFNAGKADGIKEGLRMAAEIAEQHASVEGIAQRIRAAILKATGERLDALNRRAAVEQILFDAAAGKRPLPGPEECRALAMKLGVPDELRDPRFDAMLRGESNG